jgi:hypothetical protein
MEGDSVVTVSQLIEELERMPAEAVVLMEGDGGFSLVTALEFVPGQGPAAPAEVILLPNMNE